eukprot:scaffold29773_cov22-Tisochrysis_lutea.AAC.1
MAFKKHSCFNFKVHFNHSSNINNRLFFAPTLQPAATTPQPTAAMAPQPSNTAPAATPAGQHSPKLSGEDPLALHNGYRSRHQNTGPLTYSTQLEVGITGKMTYEGRVPHT